MKAKIVKRIIMVLTLIAFIFSLNACNNVSSETDNPTISPDPSTTPELADSPRPTETSSQDTADGQFFDRSLLLISDPESLFPGASLRLGTDGEFELDVPGIGNDKGTYAINGEKLEVIGSPHEYTWTEREGEYVITLIAGGGVITIDFYEGDESELKEIQSQVSNPLLTLMENAGYIVEWDDTDGTIYTDLSYGDAKSNTYDLYIPSGISKEDEHGVILYVHGGSWNSGSKEDESPDCKRYAKEGYITASMNYTLADGSKENNIYKMVDEIQACVAALKEELTNSGYKVTKMAIGGTSAGGHLSSLYAYSRAESSALPVVLVINKVGPSDMHPETWEPVMDPLTVSFVVSLMVGQEVTLDQIQKGEAEELINSVSPAHFVTSNSCASVLAYGAKDQIVPQHHYEKLVAALEEVGVDHTFILYPNSDHMLAGDRDKTEELISTAKTYLKKYFGY